MTNLYNHLRDWFYHLTHRPVLPGPFPEIDYTKPIELTEEMKQNTRTIGDKGIIWYGEDRSHD